MPGKSRDTAWIGNELAAAAPLPLAQAAAFVQSPAPDLPAAVGCEKTRTLASSTCPASYP